MKDFLDELDKELGTDVNNLQAPKEDKRKENVVEKRKITVVKKQDIKKPTKHNSQKRQ
ncbi:hypothetical protein HOF65_07005 [bacterium]|jgi:hypothetical protein|nr:hypothetical protein [bacterium]MBT3853666.1 hypothetical protein [bacterium]MBT5491984.1 hypothetical protein [bacterium]MBT6778391.1 hypothetical protein [bacterium]